MRKFKILDKSFLKFLVVGVSNTLLSAVLMFVLEDWGYWVSTAVAYVAGAILSFFLNKHFTFKSKENSGKEVVRFIINVLMCYIVAYSLAQPFVKWILNYTAIDLVWVERITKLFGMAFYTVINYFGQRLLVFDRESVKS